MSFQNGDSVQSYYACFQNNNCMAADVSGRIMALLSIMIKKCWIGLTTAKESVFFFIFCDIIKLKLLSK